jgi:inorganic phosphate transporter, PiT family
MPFAALLPLGSGLFLGWTLGANNTANVFGTAVATRIVTLRKACFLCGITVVLGAMLQGSAGIKTLSGLTEQSITTAVIISISSAITMAILTFMKIPASTSQGVVGAILGIGLATGSASFNGLFKIIICWVGTPIGSVIIACITYKLLGYIIHKIPMSMLTRDKILWSGLLIVGTYGSYALGANNVTNSTGIFSGLIPGLSDRALAIIGGLAIAVGAITYSKRVMLAVGSGIMPLDAFAALVAVLSMAITVHVFAIIGAPVSTSQGIVGAIIGVGFMRRTRAINYKTLGHIGFGWIMTPVASLIFSAATFAIWKGTH